MLEQREQGFSLYLNGANASLQLPIMRSRSKKLRNDKQQKRNTKTAGIVIVSCCHDYLLYNKIKVLIESTVVVMVTSLVTIVVMAAQEQRLHR